ncbi:hypothetical protein BDZ89DRAFT_981555 [Hymenopellis radicata]|nr:hypothetical protein BDZ89DRAFT_981555 [Hymenopellis radicata]
MDEVVDDDKKRYDAENADEDDLQPDPDETLMLNQGSGRVWLVKIPKFLMERWAAVNVEDVHLATLRVYNESNGPGGRGPRIFLFLPPAPNTPNDPRRPTFASSTTLPTTSTEPDCYELDMVNDSVDNQIVVAERPKDASFNISDAPVTPSAPNLRARTTILTGRVKHECSLRPGFNENYRKQMRERHRKYNTPQRQIRIMEQEAGMTKSGINRLASGAGPSTSTFSDLVKTKTRGRGKGAERMARMPRNQLLDLIFQHFRDPTRWAIRDLRDKVEQPLTFLKETLSEVAFLHKSGEYTGLYELKDIYKEEGVKGENIPMPAPISLDGLAKMEEDDDDEDEDDDEDMEEVS